MEKYGVKIVDEFFDIWPVLFKRQSRCCRGSISGNRAVPLSVGMRGRERHTFFLKRVHLPINYRRGGVEFACYGKGNEVAAQTKLFRECERVGAGGDHEI